MTRREKWKWRKVSVMYPTRPSYLSPSTLRSSDRKLFARESRSNNGKKRNRNVGPKATAAPWEGEGKKAIIHGWPSVVRITLVGSDTGNINDFNGKEKRAPFVWCLVKCMV